jgi:hypothetical protein
MDKIQQTAMRHVGDVFYEQADVCDITKGGAAALGQVLLLVLLLVERQGHADFRELGLPLVHVPEVPEELPVFLAPGIVAVDALEAQVLQDTAATDCSESGRLMGLCRQVDTV